MPDRLRGVGASWSDVWLVDGARTPFVDYNGALVPVSPTRMRWAMEGAEPWT
jgi:hypothetical protein